MNSHSAAPYILQPTGPKLKAIIDNILINYIEFPLHSGNFNISVVSDHLLQFILLEGFFKEFVQT